MYEQQQAAEQHGPLAGFTVGVTAARRADELGALLQRRGAAVLHAPALRIVPLSDDSELLAATKDLIDQAPDVVVATTAIGFRGWVEAAEGWGLGETLLDRLREVELLARGPKVKGSIRAAGLTEDWSPSSESMAEVLDRLLEEGVEGRRIAIQLHGEPLPGFVEALRAGGAEVVGVPVYRWMPPEDIGPVDRLLDAAVSRGLDALTFTSAPAAASLLSRAEDRSLLPELLAALNHDVLPACVGPVTAVPLQARGSIRSRPSVSGSVRSCSCCARSFPRAPGRCPSPATGWRSGATRCWSTGRCGRCRRRGCRCCGRCAGGPGGWSRARSCCGPCRARAATNTRSRRRWPACARPWAPRS